MSTSLLVTNYHTNLISMGAPTEWGDNLDGYVIPKRNEDAAPITSLSGWLLQQAQELQDLLVTPGEGYGDIF